MLLIEAASQPAPAVYNSSVAATSPTITPRAPDPDLPLVRAAQSGDYDAFEQLVNKYERSIYTLAMRIVRNAHDAQEIVQETFLSVVEHIRDFRENSALRTWLIRIATNHALKTLRKHRTHPTVPLDASSDDDLSNLPHPDFIAQWKDEPSQLAQDHETQQLISHALAQLDDKYRLVFLLRDVEGLSTEEAADAIGITPNNVKVRLLRARLMLRERLTTALGDPATRMIPAHDHDHT